MVAAQDEGRGRRDGRDLVGVLVGLVEQPPVQPVPDALAPRLVEALVGTRDVPVEGGREVTGDPAHGSVRYPSSRGMTCMIETSSPDRVSG